MNKKSPVKEIETTDGYTIIDGYGNENFYCKHALQLNVKLTDEDMDNIYQINKEFFDNEITNSTLGRILIRRGIKSFQKLQ